MTDTVNVLRPIVGIENRTAQEVFDIMSDRIRAMLSAAPKADGMDAYTRPDTVDAITAPKAEPVSDPYKFEDEIKWLREAARYFSSRDTGGEDRGHWANVYNAENANKIADRLAELMNTQPEAPKVEQEPVAWRVQDDEGRTGTVLKQSGAWVWVKLDGMGPGWPPVSYRLSGLKQLTTLSAHPAPASDELLEALEAIVAASENFIPRERANDVGVSAAFDNGYATGLSSAAAIARAAIAQHKGPQS